jgi:hypothetical protein
MNGGRAGVALTRSRTELPRSNESSEQTRRVEMQHVLSFFLTPPRPPELWNSRDSCPVQTAMKAAKHTAQHND